jgi:hypothetical protein
MNTLLLFGIFLCLGGGSIILWLFTMGLITIGWFFQPKVFFSAIILFVIALALIDPPHIETRWNTPQQYINTTPHTWNKWEIRGTKPWCVLDHTNKASCRFNSKEEIIEQVNSRAKKYNIELTPNQWRDINAHICTRTQVISYNQYGDYNHVSILDNVPGIPAN